jgi:hypothetical protein
MAFCFSASDTERRDLKNFLNMAGCWWFTLVMLFTWEAEVRRIMV